MNRCILLCLSVVCTLAMLRPQYASAQTNTQVAASCTNLLANGSMESETGWALSNTAQAASYIEGGRDDSEVALLMEATPGEESSTPQWSTAIQKVALPKSKTLDLSFWYKLAVDSQADDARSEIALLDDEGKLLAVLLTDIAPASTWKPVELDLSTFAGQTVQLYFAAVAQNDSGTVSLTVDDVVLCDPTETPAATNTASETPAATATAAEPSLPRDSALDFDTLGIGGITLSGPVEAATRTFRLPSDWNLNADGALELDFEVAVVNQSGNKTIESPAGATLDVALNGTLLESIQLESFGEQQRQIAIPRDLLTAQGAHISQQLSFQLTSGLACIDRQLLTIVIRDRSLMLLPHSIAPVAPSLAMLPSPIIQNSFERDQALLIVADQPSAGELQAALSVAASLGRLSDGKLQLQLISLGQLTEEQRTTSNLIFVGTSAHIQEVSGLTAPSVSDAQPDDGQISIITSPWNSSRVALILSGQNDAGVIKAGQAFSSDSIAAGTTGPTALISDVQVQPAVRRVDVDRSFAILGYGAQTLVGTTSEIMRYRFDIPSGASVNGDAYVNIVFNHAPQINYERSNATVAVNGQPIGAVMLGEESTQVTTLRINIPSSATRSGINELTITGQIHPGNDCVASDTNAPWLTIWPESVLHLPLNPVETSVTKSPYPSDYPAPFSFDPGLGETAFVLPNNDSAAWNAAAQIVFDLGRQSHGAIINLVAAFSDTLDEEVRADRNLILVGSPSALPLVASIDGDPLGSSGTVDNFKAAVVYRLDPSAEVGRLTALTSPWNDQRTILAVFGENQAALDQASTALTDPRLRQQISSHTALIQNGQVIVGTLQPAAVPPVQPDSTSEGATPVETAAPTYQRPRWILPTIATSGVLIVAILAYVIGTSVLQRRKKS